MFTIPIATKAFWEEQKTTLSESGRPLNRVMTAVDFALIEKTWGYPLPAAYKEFTTVYGCPIFYDEVPYTYGYTYDRNGMTEHWSGAINSFCDTETLVLQHQYLIADADNATEEPFFPRFMLPFAGDLGQNKLLLELGSDTPRVWYWEDNPDAFGHGDNLILGLVADNLYDFINRLG